MNKTLDLNRSVYDLAREYPEFIKVMVGLGFSTIAKAAALNTVGRVMTVPKGCDLKGISLDDAVTAFREAGFSVEGVGDAGDAEPATATLTPEAPAPAAASQASAPAPTPASLSEEDRTELLKSYIARLSAGESLEDVRRDFIANFSDVEAGEIARAEQSLIESGAKIADVQRLCDVHSALFHGATLEERVARAEQAVADSLAQDAEKQRVSRLVDLPGHPMNVFARENQAIYQQIARTRAALETPGEAVELRRLSTLGIHYAKKGDLIYPVLKVNHGYSGPSDVMWGVDDEIRAELRALVAAGSQDDAWRGRVAKVLDRAEEMTFKEANILLPLCAEHFTDDEWLQMYVDLKGYDLCLIDDAQTWPDGEKYQEAQCAGVSEEGSVPSAGEVRLTSGSLTTAQLDALLNTLPLEITFIDDHEINRYWNDNGEKKLFKRPASALGREVWSCHPPKVQEMVRSVINSLKNGEQDSVDIRMEKEGEPVLVRYMAVRDRDGVYQGTMEVVQRIGYAMRGRRVGRGSSPARSAIEQMLPSRASGELLSDEGLPHFYLE